MSSYAPELLSKAVATICPDIESYIRSPMISNERQMWWELSCCILSSQVPYSLAVAAANAIDQVGLLYQVRESRESIASGIKEILSKPLFIEGKKRNYRFPIARSDQLAETYCAVLKEADSLSDLLNSFSNPVESRNWLVKNAAGMGPKQASMFLRNIGISYELAILDRHVLNYMSVLGIYSGSSNSISTLSQYCRHETILQEHAKGLDCSVGMLDWAIWIVMRVASQNKEVSLI